MTRILCARFSHLGVIAAQQRHPEMRGVPVIVGGAPELQLPVIAASRMAQQAGVRPGQSLRQAQQLCPAATFVPLDVGEVDRLGAAVLGALGRVSPAVEMADEEVYCDLSGRHAAFDGEPAWAVAIARELVGALDGEIPAVGVAGSRLVARLAAQASESRRVRRVTKGEEAAFLAPLPVSVLGIDLRITTRLVAMGIDRLEILGHLSLADLQRQFGTEGPRLFHLARGEDGGRVNPMTPPRTWLERVVLDGAVADLGVLRFTIRRCAEEVGERLRAAGLMGGAVTLGLEFEGSGEEATGVTPAAPVGNGDEVWAIVLGLLGRLTMTAPVTAVWLELSGLHPGEGRQVDMWRRGDASRDVIAQAARRLRLRFGDGSVRRPRLLPDPGDLAERRFTWDEG